MELLLVVETDDGSTSPVRVETDASASIAELGDALTRLIDVGPASVIWLRRTGAPLDGDQTVAGAQLVDGDHLVLLPSGVEPTALTGAGSARSGGLADSGLVLTVIGGPRAGAHLSLAVGSAYQVGRDHSNDLAIDDDQTSRNHLHIGVGSRSVVVTDLGSTNGTFLEGRRLTQPIELAVGQVLELGSTALTLTRTSSGTARDADLVWSDGRFSFGRPPRVARPDTRRPLKIPTPPGPLPRRKIPIAVAIAPVAMGAAMAFIIGPQMLLFALMGPVMLGATAFEDRRSGRRDQVARLEKFHSEIATIESELATAHAAVVQARRALAPDPATIAGRIRSWSPELWERRLEDTDAVTLRIGLADLPTGLNVEPPRSPAAGQEPGPTEAAALDRATTLAEAYLLDPNVPVDADLRALGVVGIAGDAANRDALLRWLILQAAANTSPRDLAIVVLVPEAADSDWSWTSWLPHTETLVAGLPGTRTAARDPDDVRSVFQVLEDLQMARRMRTERSGQPDRWDPHVLVVVPGAVPVPGPAMSRLLSGAASFGMSVLVGSPRRDHLPGECRAVVDVGRAANDTSVTVAGSGDTIGGIVVDGIDTALATELARRLAAVRDRSAATAGGDLPRQCLLLDLLDLADPSSSAVRARWAAHAGTNDLGAPIGAGPAGPVTVDLRRDGPHGLAAGTTGAGKSELLQSMIGSLAATYPASKLTFVLVDYKGGAAFKDCVALPHTVGFFTDLDAHLAERALVSLNAELRRREEILRDEGAKDLIELEARAPQRAPANLFIVFDEFAFLKKEVPAFVAGVIDIAQRGRSLGVHLMLATQRPSGVVDDNIRANTNLRIALRIADEADSTDVLDRPDAAHIPKGLPGRCFVRVGASDVTAVQSAYANARTAGAGSTRQPTTAAPFTFDSGLRRSEGSAGRGSRPQAGDEPPTDLQRLVEAISHAHRDAGVADQPPPWLDPLPDHVDHLSMIEETPPAGASELAGPIGLADLPTQQRQVHHWLDLGRSGHLVIYGTSGSGKSQLLRTIAASLTSRLSPADLHLYAMDFAAGGLAALSKLPHCAGVVGSDDPERLDRTFTVLDGLVLERRALLGATGASSLLEYRASGDRLPHVVVLVDGYGAFHQSYLGVDRGELVERFARLVADGRSVGVTFVVTADRRNAVPSALSGAISSRLVLRMADADEYASLGLPMTLAETTMPPGRAFHDGVEVQIAVIGTVADGAAQAAALDGWARTAHGTGDRARADGPAPVTRLADDIRWESLPPPGGTRVTLGVSGVDHRAAEVDLLDSPVFAVLGPDRSGRSTTLQTLVAGLGALGQGIDRYLMAPRRTPVTEAGGWTEVANGVDACDDLARRLEQLLVERLDEPRPWLLVIDDGEELAESPSAGCLSSLIRRGRDGGLVLVAAVQTHTAHRSFGGWLTDLRKAKHGLLLAPELDLDGDLFGLRLPQKSSRRFPPGRGYLIQRGGLDYIQVARVDDRSGDASG